MAKPQFSMNIQFCPKCGCKTLERDWLRQVPDSPDRQVKDGSEWICACGFSFLIQKSKRWRMAEQLFASERRRRPPVKFATKDVGEATANAYLAHHSAERTRRKTNGNGFWAKFLRKTGLAKANL